MLMKLNVNAGWFMNWFTMEMLNVCENLNFSYRRNENYKEFQISFVKQLINGSLPHFEVLISNIAIYTNV